MRTLLMLMLMPILMPMPIRNMPKLLVLMLLLVPGLAAATHAARLVEVEVVDRDSGQPLPVHWHQGQAWVAGTPGHRYAVRLANRTGGRLLAVLSVDGVNALSGSTAATDQGGYVLAPWGTTEVTGWRKSLSEVAAFEFTALHDSYAARTGRPANVGVIGVAVFQERRHVLHPDAEIAEAPSKRRGTLGYPQARAASPGGGLARAESAAPAPEARTQAGTAAAAERAQASVLGDSHAPSAEPLGTGHGAREWSSVRRTRFERASSAPAQVLSIRYDSYANLAAIGVVPQHWPHPQRPRPQAFPSGFVPDPH